jgi:hypothetical protein
MIGLSAIADRKRRFFPPRAMSRILPWRRTVAPKLEYTITKICDQFFVLDSEDEFVGTFESETAAKAEAAREQLDDAIWGRTKELV